MSVQKYRITCRCDCGVTFKHVSTSSKYGELADDSEELKTLMSKLQCKKCKKASPLRTFALGDGAVDEKDLVEPAPIVSVDNYHCNGCNKPSRFYREFEDHKMAHCPRCGSQDVKFMGHSTAGVISTSSQTMIRALDNTAKMTMDTYGMSDLNLNSNMRPGDSCAPKLPPHQQKMTDAFFSGGGLPGANASRIAQNAIAGAYKDNANNPVAKLHKAKQAPKFDLINAPPVGRVKQGEKLSAYDKILNRPN